MNINDKHPNYAERYINHADIPETRARGRRWPAFLEASRLIENLEDDPPKRRALFDALGRGGWPKDHTTYLELGNMAVIMSEPYSGKLEDFDHERFAVIEVPTNIAPYCGSWDPAPGAKPGTKTFLITSILKKRQLDEVKRRLEKAAASMPLWNYAGEDEE
jgi:hypothetical protein